VADLQYAKEEIRRRVNILDLVSEYVTLKRSGKSYKGLCPFHAEKTPSFTVSEEFQTWHCFGCGEHGDVFSFLMKIENLTFVEALERLAKRAGVELLEVRERQVSRKEQLAKLNYIAAKYYSALLKRTAVSIEYLHNRGLADQTIDLFQIGYAAPGWDNLTRFLVSKGIDLKDAEQVGLVIRSDRGAYDRFRHRIIFPIFDIQERVIAFGGRALGDEQPKYLNSPDTPLFSKTRSLYGLNLARKAIAEKGYTILVEGYMDVIAAHQAGFTNCVATLGTSLTADHINILARYAKKIVLAYDADSAGISAALRGAAMFQEADCEVLIARLPSGDDPDSLLRKGRVSDFAAAINGALPVIDYRLMLLREHFDLSKPAQRAALLKGAAQILADVPSFVEREKYIKELVTWHPNWDVGQTRAQDQIRADVEAIISRKTSRLSRHKIQNSSSDTPKPTTGVERAEKIVLSALIRNEKYAEIVLDALSPEDFSTELARNAAKAMFEIFKEKKGIYLPEVLDIVDKETGGYLSELAAESGGPPITEQVLRDCIKRIKDWELKNTRISDILNSSIKNGLIDVSGGPHKEAMERLVAFLKKSGKLPEPGRQEGGR
jgi:DNA primase